MGSEMCIRYSINDALRDIRDESKEQWSNIRAIDRKVATLEAKTDA